MIMFDCNTRKIANSYIIKSDFPDLDVIRVDDTYYMISTTMHFFPGGVILKSYNLVDWEFCSYVFDVLEDAVGQKLDDNKGIYGKGMWAASLRYHNGIFYVAFVANDTHKTYLYTTHKIDGNWKKSYISGFYHDLSILFDDDDRVYIVSGNTNIQLTEMEKDLSGPKKDGICKTIIKDQPDSIALGYEGSHIYKIDGKYYIFLIHAPKGMLRTESCFVSDKIDGPYVGKDVLSSDLCGWNSGVAQGGIVQTKEGDWFGILFQDHGALGRIPVLVPVDFVDGFPVFGNNGKVEQFISITDNHPDYKYKPLYGNEFVDTNGKLNYFWQWNHIPDKNLISFENNYFSVTTNKIVKNIVQASNTLTQRTFNEECEAYVDLDFSYLNDGDFAGICALEGEYGFIGITKIDSEAYLVLAQHKIPYSPWSMGVYDSQEPELIAKQKITGKKIRLKVKMSLHYQNEFARFYYYDNKSEDFKIFGNDIKLRYTLDQFVGVRYALFCYSTQITGGKAVFSSFNIV